jgi:hypothetical protein
MPEQPQSKPPKARSAPRRTAKRVVATPGLNQAMLPAGFQPFSGGGIPTRGTGVRVVKRPVNDSFSG